jgi:hypothetical protein
MTHKIPVRLVDTNSQRIEAHELLTSGPLTAQDIKDANAFLVRRAQVLGKRPAGVWHMAQGVITMWVHA